MSSSYLTEATATLEYSTYTDSYSLPHSKTVDLGIGEEFIKKDSVSTAPVSPRDETVTSSTQGDLLQTSVISSSTSTSTIKMSSGGSLPPLTYTTTTTIPTIASQASAPEETGVLYCNLDDLSRYIPDNFSFDQIIPEQMGSDDNVSVQVLSLPSSQSQTTSKPMSISFPNADQRLAPAASSVQIQLKSSSAPASSIQTLSLAPNQVIDTTKLTGQLSVVQELPEVSKLVFQEIKQEEGQDSIVSILDNMKQEHETSSMSPLDYTVNTPNTESPLNLVNNIARQGGVKRVTAPIQHIPPDPKRIKNVYLVQGQNGQQIIQEVVGSLDTNSFNNQRMSPVDMNQPQDQLQLGVGGNVLCLEPPSPTSSDIIKKEQKSKSTSPKMNNVTKSVNGSTMPSSKTCNWVFENGQVCGKTFSKSYNLVVHMRMHEDIRPFACTLCDQTFRQKAHLQRHETTHGIQSKNIYRQPAAAGGAKKKKKRAGAGQQLSKGLQNRLQKINQNLNKANGDINEDSTGEEFMEDEEEDVYVPNGPKSILPDNEHSNGFDNVMETDNNNKVKQEVGDLNMNIITADQDDDTSTVQDILHTVNSVPTLEQSLNCDISMLRPMTTSRHTTSSLPHITKLVESTSISTLPPLSADLSTTSSTTLPGSSQAYSMFHTSPATSQTNILFTTLSAPSVSTVSHKSLSFIETSVPGTFTSGSRQVVIDNIDEHSPEIQAEILNALLADQTGYVEEPNQELWEEEIYRLTTLPPSWWVSRKRRSGSSMDEVSYYSPEGYCFRNRSEIQDYLTHNTVPKDLRTEELRSPPLPIDQIPIIEESYVHRSSLQTTTQPLDANSIAQALIANLKPEPLESLKEALSNSENAKLRDSLSLPSSPPPAPSTCSSNVMTLSTVS